VACATKLKQSSNQTIKQYFVSKAIVHRKQNNRYETFYFIISSGVAAGGAGGGTEEIAKE
jgi:hypothetical protein